MRGRILVVDRRTPTPDQDSGSASTFAYLRILAKAGFGVTFAAQDLTNGGRYTKAISDLGIATATAPEWTSLNAVVEVLAPRSDVLLLYRGTVAARVLDIARRAAPAAKVVFHPVDLHFLRMEREAALTGDRGRARSAEAMRATELDMIRRADATIVVSSHESTVLADLVPNAAVHRIPILRQTPQPSGIFGWRRLCELLPGLGPLKRRPARRSPAFDARRDFVFIGSFGHRPNADAVFWFVREVWPRIQAKGFPDRFVIVGSKMPGEILDLASEKIEIRGHVADLAGLFDGCRLSVAPLRYGGGIKGKIVTSLSYGVPVVASSVAAEGMGLRHEEDILIADDPDEMADRIVELYAAPDLWERLSSNGYAAFQSKFSEDSGAAKVLAVFDGLVSARAL